MSAFEQVDAIAGQPAAVVSFAGSTADVDC